MALWWVNGDHLQRAYAIPRSTAPGAPASQQSTADTYLLRTHPNTILSVSVGSLGPGAHKVCLSPLSFSGGIGFDSKHNFAPPTILLGLHFCPSMWDISSKLLQHRAATAPASTVLLGLLCPWICRATQDRQVMVERSDRMWSTEEGNGKPLQYSFIENPMSSMKRQKIGH